jgi:hypothetical protein
MFNLVQALYGFILFFGKRLKTSNMKSVSLSLMFLVFLLSCKKDTPDPSKQFPGCVGITKDFNPYSIGNPYLVRLTGTDIIDVKLIFTNYQPLTLWVTPTWRLWVGVITPNSYKYYEGSCSQSYGTKKWYGDSGIDYKDQFSPLHFEFDVFTCNEVSGSCYLVKFQTSDTLHYSFTGNR